MCQGGDYKRGGQKLEEFVGPDRAGVHDDDRDDRVLPHGLPPGYCTDLDFIEQPGAMVRKDFSQVQRQTRVADGAGG